MSNKTVSMFCQGNMEVRFPSLRSLLRMLALSSLSVTWILTSVTADEAPWWLDPKFSNTNEVNEGRLEFLPDPPTTPVHHHQHVITIYESSLRDGWVRLEQCHDNLDPVGRAEIVFGEGRVRNLSIDHQAGIGKAWISDHSVQLTNVGRASRLCLSAETKVMKTDGRDSYVLRNGPFMRRFLDGYYPMRVTMKVYYPCDSLEFSKIRPQSQPGFRVTHSGCAVAIEALFEGRLTTEIRFRSSSLPMQPPKIEP